MAASSALTRLGVVLTCCTALTAFPSVVAAQDGAVAVDTRLSPVIRLP